MRSHLARLSATLAIRGALLAALATAGLFWSGDALLQLAFAAGGVLAVLGFAELVSAVLTRALLSTRAFYLGSGLIATSFGVVLAFVARLPVDVAILWSVGWLVTHAVFLVLLAGRVWYNPAFRIVALTMAAITAGGVLVLRAAAPEAPAALLEAVMPYLPVYGLAQLLAAIAIGRFALAARARVGEHRTA